MNTDTNQASELFELCKEVWKRTEWYGDELPLKDEKPTEDFYPLYTSDYLLEKLPNDTGLFKTILSQDEHRYFANSEKQIGGAYSDTPLKALLKLTLA